MTASSKIPSWLRWIGVALVCAGLAYALAGCTLAETPPSAREPQGGTAWVIGVPEWLGSIGSFLWGIVMTVFVGGGVEGGPPGGGVDWLTLGLQVIGGLTGTSGLLAALSPAGRRTLGVVADPDASWKSTARALGNVATFGTIKPPAAPAQGV